MNYHDFNSLTRQQIAIQSTVSQQIRLFAYKMPTLEPVPRLLRKVTLYAFPASALLFIFTSFACYSFLPLLSLGVVALSSALALFVLHHDKSEPPSSSNNPSTRHSYKIARKDCLLAIAHFISLLITYVRMWNGWHDDVELIISTYTSAFIIVDMAIHIYFCAHTFQKFVFAKVCSCDDCQGPPAYNHQSQRHSPPQRSSPGGSTERKTIIEFDTDDEATK